MELRGSRTVSSGGTAANLIQELVEVFVCHPVVESPFGCRAHHYDHLLRIDPELCQDFRVRTKPGEVELLLEAGVAEHFLFIRSESPQRRGGKDAWHD